MKLHLVRVPMSLRRSVVLVGALSLGACADTLPNADPTPVVETETPQPEPRPTGEVTSATVEANLKALSDLDLFEVGALLTDSQRSGGSCYGYPCPEERESIEAALTTKLDRLVGLTVDLTSTKATCDEHTFDARVDANIAVLDSLNIVEIGEFLRVEPANDPMCYNLPCPADMAAADAANCEKLGRLEALADRAAEAFAVSRAPMFGALTPAQEAEVATDLAYLSRLEIFEVGAFVVPSVPWNCYVCPSPEATVTHQVDRLSAFTDKARTLDLQYRDDAPSAVDSCDSKDKDASLEALANLALFEVGALIAKSAAEEGLCYVGHCTEANEAEARAIACRRVDAARRLAEAAGDN